MIQKNIHYIDGGKGFVLIKEVRCCCRLRNITIDSEFIDIRPDGRVILRVGYTWNGTNCFPDFERDQHAVAMHDGFYFLMKEGKLKKKYRKHADKCLFNNLVKDGVNKYRAKLMYWAVRLFGGIVLLTTKP